MELQMKPGPQHRREQQLQLQLPEQPQQQKPQRPSSFSQSIPVNGVKVTEKEWVISIWERLEQAHLASSRSKLCIYRVPECLRENDDKAFIPQVVSLGPYHHKRNESLRDMEEHKLRSLDLILKRTSQDVKLYLDSISEVEVQARNCYVGPISHTSHEFVYMMVLDGCFMLEIFQGAVDGFEQLGYPRNDPIFAWRSVMHSIRQDMVMLENQIPLFILDRLLELQFGVNGGPGVRPQAAQLALRFLDFVDSLMSTDETLRNRYWKKRTKYANTDLDGLHCLDLLRRKPMDLPTNWMRWKPQPLDAMDKQRQQLVRCATELRVAGVKFRKRNTERFWEVKFKNGTLCIPRLLVHDGTKSLLLNMKAYEHCHIDCGNEVTSYLILMDAQNQMGQLILRAEAMSRELEASEREKVSLDNERSTLLEKVEHLECDLALERRECERKLSELKSQVRARLLEAEARGVEKYRSSEAFKEEITKAIAPGYTMGATEVRDWVLGHYPGVSFADSGLIFEDDDVEAVPSATEVAEADGGGGSEEGEIQPHREVPPTPGRGGSDQEALPAEDEAANPTDVP
ncbi:UPF0481 protein At3g47200-like [Macadamia integrifolia]|uniref:UPF0481 protein At3g47200-like n=1 Tax=Macadamia integrifolia TaxID=60698 RepID=UPI001C528AE8|nr:UPF0481 protein At3g47200-like [Macadamia integrifolia]